MAIKTSIRVLSLIGQSGRRNQFASMAKETKLDWQLFDAHTQLSSELAYNRDNASVAWGKPLLPAELGCYSSHWSLWNEFIKSDAEQLIVFEDDVIVDWNFIDLLASTELSQKGINYLKLYCSAPTSLKLLKQNYPSRGRHIVQFMDYSYGSVAYAITRPAAQKLLAHCATVRRPIDVEMDRYWDHKVPALAIYPFPVLERFGESVIGSARDHATELAKELILPRLGIRLSERVRRYLILLSARPQLHL